MNQELKEYNFNSLVYLIYWDVYNGGFLIDGKSFEVEVIFFDFLVFWEVLYYFFRWNFKNLEDKEWVLLFNLKKSVYICIFLLCIEQVIKIVLVMWCLGWVDIDMVEIVNRKYYIFCECVGLNFFMDCGVNNLVCDVDEVFFWLIEIEVWFWEYVVRLKELDDEMDGDEDDGLIKWCEKKEQKGGRKCGGEKKVKIDYKFDFLESFEVLLLGVFMWMEGWLIICGEFEIKIYILYLVFVMLLIEWIEEDEVVVVVVRYFVIGE